VSQREIKVETIHDQNNARLNVAIKTILFACNTCRKKL